MKQIISKIVNILFPISCTVCKKALSHDDYYRLCAGCMAKLERIDSLYCEKCGQVLIDGGKFCFDCRKKTHYHFENIRSSCLYKGAVKDIVHKFKYGNRQYLKRLICMCMSELLSKSRNDINPDYLVYVPVHWLKKYIRGYDQSELIAKGLSEFSGIPVLRALKRIKYTKPLYKLNREERSESISGCFEGVSAAIDLIKDKNIVIVDDVCTTCTTINECASVLRSHGAKNVYGVTFARD